MKRLTLTVDEMAKQLGLSRPTAYALVNQADFPALRVGKRIVIPCEAFEGWLRESAKNRVEVEIRHR